MKYDFIDIILKILIVLGTILIIYWFIQLILGNSPTISQFNTGLILVIVGLIAHLYHSTGKFSQFIEGTFPRFEKNIQVSFDRIKNDFDTIKDDMNLVKKKLKI